MTPREKMLARRAKLRLVIFDCDGVIVDSEPVSNRIVAEELTLAGWPMDAAEANDHFLGMAMTDMVPVIEARLGRPVSEAWRANVVHRIITVLGTEAQAIPGAIATLLGVTALGLPWRIASNSSHEEMRAKFAAIGITSLVENRVHSHRDVARGKPAPDLFLATAAAEGVDPAECVVIEDSVPGARAAASAGMDCLGFVPHGDGAAMRAVGAMPFDAMADLPGLIAAALTVPA